MSWPSHSKSKKLIRLIENCEMSVYGDEMELWSPSKLTEKNFLLNRVNKLLDEIGKTNKRSLPLFEKVKIIAENVGISFWDESNDSDSDKELSYEKNSESDNDTDSGNDN
jgi:hypothetical protein